MPSAPAHHGADDAPVHDLVYGPNDRPSPAVAFVAALQHLLAILVPIVTPGLLICQALNVPTRDTTLIVSMSLVISGIATFLQCRRFGPLGAGLLIVQGTSFNFVVPADSRRQPDGEAGHAGGNGHGRHLRRGDRGLFRGDGCVAYPALHQAADHAAGDRHRGAADRPHADQGRPGQHGRRLRRDGQGHVRERAEPHAVLPGAGHHRRAEPRADRLGAQHGAGDRAGRRLPRRRRDGPARLHRRARGRPVPGAHAAALRHRLLVVAVRAEC